MTVVSITGQGWEIDSLMNTSRLDDCPILLTDGHARFLNRYYTEVGKHKSYRPKSCIPIELVITDDFRIYHFSERRYLELPIPLRFIQVVELVRSQSVRTRSHIDIGYGIQFPTTQLVSYYDRITQWYGLTTTNELYGCDSLNISSRYDLRRLMSEVDHIGLIARSTLIIRKDNQWLASVNCDGGRSFNPQLVIGDLPTGQFLEQRENVIQTDDGYWLFKIGGNQVTSIRIRTESIDSPVIDAVSISSNGRSGAHLLTDDGRVFYSRRGDDFEFIRKCTDDDKWIRLYTVNNLSLTSTRTGRLFLIDKKQVTRGDIPTEIFISGERIKSANG